MSEQKRQLRKVVTNIVKSITDGDVAQQSTLVINNVLKLITTTKPLVIATYLSMPKEIQTNKLIETLQQQKLHKICVPVMVDDRNMKMVELNENDLVSSFQRDKWGIPILPLQMERKEIDVHNIDIVITPGLAFDRHGGRLGRGKGYYDTYFQRVDGARKEKGLLPCFKIGVAFIQQLLTEDVGIIPMDENDVHVDVVCVADEVIVAKGD
jgi:5-formyltetrahydrofolate cyclo-ligase